MLELSDKENFQYGLAVAHYYIASCNFVTKNNNECLTHLARCHQISKENNFYALEGKALVYYGLYYESVCDLVFAFQYYLDAIVPTKKAQDFCSTGTIYNNMGSNLQQHGDFVDAYAMYKKAYEYTEKGYSPFRDEYLLTILFNLLEVSRLTNHYEDAKKYLDLCEVHLKHNKDVLKKYLAMCYSACYYLDIDDTKTAYKLIDELLESHIEEDCEKFLVFNVLETLCKSLLEVQDKKYAKIFLSLMTNLNKDQDFSSIRTTAELKIQYFKLFGNETQLKDACCEFYEILSASESLTNKLLVERLNEKISSYHMINEMRKEYELLEKKTRNLMDLINYDELTKLYNRRYIMKQLSKSYPLHTVIGIVMLDADYFKEYNDTYGHPLGDKALLAIAECMKKFASESFVPCRYGGDEFICICIGLDQKKIEEIINKIREDLKEEKIANIKSLCSSYLTVSIGYSIHEFDGSHNMQSIIDKADAALYESKLQGRNTVSYVE